MNDNSPVFTRTLYVRKVVENVAVGTTVEVIRADDADAGRNGQVRYRIMTGNEAGNVYCEDTTPDSFVLTTLLTKNVLFSLESVTVNETGTENMCITMPTVSFSRSQCRLPFFVQHITLHAPISHSNDTLESR